MSSRPNIAPLEGQSRVIAVKEVVTPPLAPLVSRLLATRVPYRSYRRCADYDTWGPLVEDDDLERATGAATQVHDEIEPWSGPQRERRQ